MLKKEIAPRIFTENDFISMLIPLLSKNGIMRLNETELKKKLYYYYLKNEYRELFQDIVPYQENGIYHYKTFSNNVVWDSMNPENLKLIPKRNLDLSFYEQYLTEDGIKKMYQMAEEFGIRYKAEFYSQKLFNIYANNPNHFYHLCTGTYHSNEYSWQLITDGTIKQMDRIKFQQEHFYYENPTRPHSEIQLRNAISATVEIENANYVLMQGLENEHIKKLKAYTNLIDLEKLKQIANIDSNNCETLINEKPYIRKYILK